MEKNVKKPHLIETCRIIERLIKSWIGLESETIGRSSVQSAVQRRMYQLGLHSETEYLEVLSKTESEQHSLIELMVVSETWFFRDSAPFEHLRVFASEFRRNHPSRVFKALSLPCSTGEEPLSIAITLLQAGFAAEQIQVDGIDVSKNALARAAKGQYSAYSFRGRQNPRIIQQYFTQRDDHFEVDETVKNCVRFYRANVLENDFETAHDDYDVIFCRNLLIYFGKDNKQKVLDKLWGLLHADGLLFVGHAEAPSVPESRFSLSDKGKSFSFRKLLHPPEPKQVAPPPRVIPKAAASRQTVIPVERRRGNQDNNVTSRNTSARPLEVRSKSEREQENSASNEATHSIENIERLADAGQYNDAVTLCENYLQQNSDDAHAHYLLGLLKNSTGDDAGSEECFRKALYLDPKHYEAMIHLALILEKQNKTDAAKKMFERAERSKAGNNRQSGTG